MYKMRHVLQAGLVTAALAALTCPALAQETAYSLTVQNGKFEPSTLAVKAGVKFKLVVSNKGTKPAEFESPELNREKIVPAGASVPALHRAAGAGRLSVLRRFRSEEPRPDCREVNTG